MSLRRRAVKGSLLLALSESVSWGSAFVRNMILARMLTKADFGIAATFSLIITLLEFSAKLGVGQFVIRDKDGGKSDFIEAAHLVQFAVALFSAAVIAGCAGPLSLLFGIPGQRWAIMALALAPMFRSVEHLDIRRYERDLRFGPALLVEAFPQLAITLAAWPVASWLGDYRAVLVLMLAKGLLSCTGSHLLAEQPYRWRVDLVDIGRILRFGWPLIVNGFLMFGVLHGDQFLVATYYTMADLGTYAAAAALNMAPAYFFARVFNSVMLPLLADVQDDPAAFARRYRQVLVVVTLFAVVCALGTILGAEALMRLAYGAKYRDAGALLACLGAANAFRNLRIAPALAAIARGDSQNQMFSSWWRVTALIPGAALAWAQQPLWTIAGIGLLGEGLACWVSFVRLRRRDAIPLSDGLRSAGWIGLAVGTSGIAASLGLYHLPTAFGVLMGALGAGAGAAVMFAALPELRSEGLKLYGQWRKAGWRGCIGDLGRATPPARATIL